MANINLPVQGEEPWDAKLNAAVAAVNAEAEQTTAVLETGRLSGTNLSNSFAERSVQDTVETGRLSDSSISSTYAEKTSFPVNVKDYGAKGDLKSLSDISLSLGSNTLTSSLASFTQSDVGKMADVYNAGSAVEAPTISATVNATSGGSLSAGTYSYRASVLTAGGETIPSAAVSVNVTTPNSVVRISVTNYPTRVGPGAVIRLYGRSAGSEQLIGTLPAQPRYGRTFFLDTGAITPAGTLPTVESSKGTLSGVITSVISPTTATLSVTSNRTATGLTGQFGTDDGPSIAAALATGANTVYLPPGRYLNSVRHQIGTGQTLRGAGRGSTLIKSTETGSSVGAPSSLVRMSGVSGARLQSLTLDACRDTAAQGGNVIYVQPGSLSCEVDDVRVQNAPGYTTAICFLGASKIVASNFETDTVGYGVVIGSTSGQTWDSSDCEVRNGIITNSDFNGVFFTGDIASNPNPATIYRHHASGLRIIGFGDTAFEVGQSAMGCTATDIHIDGLNSGTNGFLLRDNSGTVVNGFTIMNVRDTLSGFGILVLPQYVNYIGRAKFSDGEVVNCLRGVDVRYLYASTFSNVTVSNSTNYGWLIGNAVGVNFVGCGAYRNGYSGFEIGISGSLTTSLQFSGCWANGNSQSTIGAYSGFNVFNSASLCIFTGCAGTDDQTTHTQQFGFNNLGSNCYFDPTCIGSGNTSSAFGGSSFGAGIVTGGRRLYPQPVVVTSLPTASSSLRGFIHLLQGNGTSTADTLYTCLMSSTGTYSWKQIVAG